MVLTNVGLSLYSWASIVVHNSDMYEAKVDSLIEV